MVLWETVHERYKRLRENLKKRLIDSAQGLIRIISKIGEKTLLSSGSVQIRVQEA